jgi:hypothetical protein
MPLGRTLSLKYEIALGNNSLINLSKKVFLNFIALLLHTVGENFVHFYFRFLTFSTLRITDLA